MFQPHPLEAVFSLIFTPQRDPEDRRDASTLYIGLGDQFDDDRRLVHAHWSGHIAGLSLALGETLTVNLRPIR